MDRSHTQSNRNGDILTVQVRFITAPYIRRRPIGEESDELTLLISHGVIWAAPVEHVRWIIFVFPVVDGIWTLIAPGYNRARIRCFQRREEKLHCYSSTVSRPNFNCDFNFLVRSCNSP